MNKDRFNAKKVRKKLVYCELCREPMEYIYDKSLRDTCYECGGVAKTSYDERTNRMKND